MSERSDIQSIVSKKTRGERITMLTAYDYPTAVLLDRCGIDLILVGDSVANVVLGLVSTKQVGMEAMLHHARAVTRGVSRAFVLADMPFDAYQVDPSQAVQNARRFIDEAGCQAVKLEWFDRCAEVVRGLRQAGIPVMGHVGLTPQTALEFKVQGKDQAAAGLISDQAKALEAAGCFAIVLECVPQSLARQITADLKVPTIGIGAGKFCDGQVLVLHDILGLNDRKVPKFVKRYGDIGAAVTAAVRKYKEEVERGEFPDEGHSFH